MTSGEKKAGEDQATANRGPEARAGLSPISRRLTGVFLVHMLVQCGLALISPGRFSDTAAGWAKRWMLGQEASDSWWPMYAADEYMRADEPAPRRLYDEMLFARGVKFQYPPSALLAFAGLRGIMERTGTAVSLANRTGAEGPLKVVRGPAALVSWSLVLATALLVILVLTTATRQAIGGLSRTEMAWLALLGAGFTLSYYPLLRGYGLGQIQTWLTALLAATLLLWMKGKEKATGALVAVVCAVKPSYAPLLLWAGLRQRWGFVVTALVVTATIVTVSVRMYGLSNHVAYISALSHIARHGETFYPNQSMNGLLNRFYQNGSNLKFENRSYPPYHPVVHAGTVLSSFVLFGGFLFFSVTRANRPPPLEFAAGLLTVTMASPIAWEHHYGILLPIFALAAPMILNSGSRVNQWWLLAGFLLTANLVAPAKQAAELPWGLNILQSYLFIGALIVLLLLYGMLSPGKEFATRVSGGGREPEGAEAS